MATHSHQPAHVTCYEWLTSGEKGDASSSSPMKEILKHKKAIGIEAMHLENFEISGTSEEDQKDEEPWAKSKWETSEETLNKLDGLRRKRKNLDSEDENETPLNMVQWLQKNTTDDYMFRRQTEPGKKRVRWADIEARQNQERAREIGFVVGHTDWNQMTDPTFASSALTKTKYI